MHELRIAESIANKTLREIERRNLPKIRAIGIRIGALSGINIDSLDFGFQAITADTALAGVKLEIENIPIRGTCRACHKEFEVPEFMFVCPHCYSGDIEVTQGEELDIAYLETD